MTSTFTVKLFKDLRASWSRFALMIIAITISLTVFGGVLFAWSASARETRDAYASTEPASATILLDKGVDAAELTDIAASARSRPGVLEAVARTQFNTKVSVDGDDRDIPLQVFAAPPDDPMRMARFTIDHHSWPPAAGEIYLARDTLSLLDVSVGDTITVEAPGGDPVTLRVATTVYDPSLSPSVQEQTGHGYVSTAALATSGHDASANQLKIQIADPGQTTPSRDRDTIGAKAGDVGQWLEREHGLTVQEIQVPEPYAHPHQWQSDALLLSLLAGGAAALLLSSILVANMLNNLFIQQIPQIGILKAIGARSGRIARKYLLMTLLVSTTATLLALTPAILIGRGGADTFLGFLGIQPESLDSPWWVYAALLIVGVGLPPAMALVPLVKASRITVRAAIDHRGLAAKPSAATSLLAWLGRLRRLDRGLLMAIRNTLRRPARFGLAVGLLASAGAVFVAGMSLSTSVEATAAEQTAARDWDVDVQLTDPVAMDDIAPIEDTVADVDQIEGLNVTTTSVAAEGRLPVTSTYPDQGHGRVSVTAVPADATMFTRPELTEGRWLKPDETGAIVLNQVAMENTVPGVAVGDTVELTVGGELTAWRVVGLAEEKGRNSAVYATANGYATATGQRPKVNQLRITTNSHDEQTRDKTAKAVNQALTNAGINVKSADSVSRNETISSSHMGPLVTIILVIAIAMGVIGGIGLASTMSANILDRTREFGVLHAIGARPKTVRRTVLAEGVFLAMASCAVAAIPALVLTAILGAGLGNLFFYAALPFRISGLAVGIWIVLVTFGGILATEAAATRASRITVREALTYL